MNLNCNELNFINERKRENQEFGCRLFIISYLLLSLYMNFFSFGLMLNSSSHHQMLRLTLIVLSSLSLILFFVFIANENFLGEHWRLRASIINSIFSLIWSFFLYWIYDASGYEEIGAVTLTLILLINSISNYSSRIVYCSFNVPIFTCLNILVLHEGEAIIEKITFIVFIFLFMELVIYMLRKWFFKSLINELQAKILLEEITNLSFTDALTGVKNRRWFDRELKNRMIQSGANDTEFSIVYIDVDYFKKYNDSYGHNEGDKCLIIVASIISNVIGITGSISRIGGEEFALILPGISASEASVICFDIKQAVNDASIPHTSSSVSDKVTLSQGVAEWKKWMNVSDLLSITDQALYKAKCHGRNRIEVASV